MLRTAVLLVVGLMLASSAQAQTPCTHYASPQGGGDGTSQSAPFHLADFWQKAQPGATLCLLDGTYTQEGIQPPQGLSGQPGNPITIRALNDGGVYIDGQFQRITLFLQDTSWLVIEGIDVGNSAAEALSLSGAHHTILRRVCAWNANRPIQAGGSAANIHTALIWNAHDNLLEDLCLFGWGRNTWNEFDNSYANTVRRAWFRWDGWPNDNGATCGGPAIQNQYHTWSGTSVYENLIVIFSGGLFDRSWPYPGQHPCSGLSAGIMHRDGVTGGAYGTTYNGVLTYGYPDNSDILGEDPYTGVGFMDRWVPTHMTDIFLDGRYGKANSWNANFGCDLQDDDQGTYHGGRCDLQHVDRVTSILTPSMTTPGYFGSGVTHAQECTALEDCPNFYTGTGPGGTQGARQCFRYQDGTLTSTKLWPWPMDGRIKQALQRSGVRPGLSGTAGAGYEAGTVTSEIVSRYGPLPSTCAGTGQTTLLLKLPAPYHLRLLLR